MWLSLFVLSGFLSVGAVVGGTNPFDYLGNKETAEVYNDQDEPQPEVKFGKPFNVEQCLPGLDAFNAPVTNRVIVYLGDAIRNENSGSVVDSEGNAIVPKGYKYSFFNTENDARNNNNAFLNDRLEIHGPVAGERIIWLKVYSVIDNTKYNLESFNLVLTNENCDLSKRLVKLPNLYSCADTNDEGTFNLSRIGNELYYGQTSVKLSVNGFELIGDLTNYKAKNNTEVLVEIDLSGTNEKGSRSFRLYTESFELNPNEVSLVVNQSKEDLDGTQYGVFNLNTAKEQIILQGDNVDYYTITFYNTKDDSEKGINVIPTPEALEVVDGTVVYSRIVSNLTKNFCVKSGKSVALKVMDKPLIPKLGNLYYCEDRPSKNIPLTDQTVVIADGRTIVTEEESQEEGFDPTDKFTIDYFNSKADADSNQNKIVGVEIVVDQNQFKPIWARLTDLKKKSFSTAMFYVSLGYDTETLKSGEVSGGITPFYQIETNTLSYSVNLRKNENEVKGKSSWENIADLNPTDKIRVVYYKSDADAKMDKRMDETMVTAYPIKMGEKKGPLFARVIMEDGFDCKASNYVEFYITLGTMPSIEYIPVTNIPSKSPLYLCQDINGNVNPVELEFKNTSKYPVKVMWKVEVVDGCTDIFTGQKFTCFLPLKNYENDIVDQVVGPGEVATLSRSIAGKYRADVIFEEEPFKDAKSKGIDTDVWTVFAPPILEVQDADAKGMINSMEIDEKGETKVELSIVGGDVNDYEFALDNGGFQQSNQFYNVPIGDHSVRARNKITSCSTSTTFSVFGFPKYFTPNGDGYNDTWNIPGLKGHQEARIYIYDKSGRLLKQLSPFTEGWDGTWNGKAMPSTDYWFTVEFVNDYKAPNDKNGQKVSYKGHFSLKR